MRGVEQIPWLYDSFCSVMERFGLARWRAWLVGGARGRVLEVGAGTGRNLKRYDGVELVIAIEPSSDSLRAARQRAGHALLVRASAEALPFRAGAFDTVVSSLAFCSVPDASQGLAEVKRVLAPTGTLRMLEHVRETARFAARVQDFIAPAWKRLTGGCHLNRDTEETVRRAGFALSEVRASGTMRRFVATPTRHDKPSH